MELSLTFRRVQDVSVGKSSSLRTIVMNVVDARNLSSAPDDILPSEEYGIRRLANTKMDKRMHNARNENWMSAVIYHKSN